MRLKIKFGADADMNAFRHILKLDIEAHGADVITAPGAAERRFEKYPDSMIFLYDEDNPEDLPIGSICFFPVKENIMKMAFEENIFTDDDLDTDDILCYKLNDTNIIFVLDIIVDLRYRGNGLGAILNYQMGKFLKAKNDSGYHIGLIYLQAVSGGGVNAAEKCGGSIVSKSGDGNDIFLITLDLNTLADKNTYKGVNVDI